jgi:hypothetical protein
MRREFSKHPVREHLNKNFQKKNFFATTRKHNKKTTHINTQTTRTRISLHLSLSLSLSLSRARTRIILSLLSGKKAVA